MNDYFNVRSFGAKGDGVANDTAKIQAAINALPAGGGIVYFPPGTYKITSTLTMPDKPIILQGAGAGSIIDIGANAISAITIPDGLTKRRQYYFRDFYIEGGGVVGQSAWAMLDQDAKGQVFTDYVSVDDVETLFNVQAYDLTYTDQLVMHFSHASYVPPDLATATLVKTPDAAGAFAAMALLIFFESEIDLPSYGGGTGVSFDCNCDIVFDHTSALFRGDASCSGLGGTNSFISGITSAAVNSLTSYGLLASEHYDLSNIQFYKLTINWFAYAQSFFACYINDSTLIATGEVDFVACKWYTAAPAALTVGLDIEAGASLITLSKCTFLKSYQGSYSIAALRSASKQIDIDAIFLDTAPAWADHTPLGISLLAGADECKIAAQFNQDFTVAAIQTAAQKLIVSHSMFFETGAHNTVLETGAADKTLVTGCIGIASGGGYSVPGVNSLVGADNIG